MSKKKRDDSYFAAKRRKNKKYMMIIIPAVAALAAIGIAAGVMYQGPSFGALGSAHEHAVFEVRLDGEPIDFSQDKYQVQSRFIHVEGGDGTTLHRHSSSVPVGEFFKSVGMNIENDCFTDDEGSRYCDDGTNQLRFFVNGTERGSVTDYILRENDRILIIYGDESDEEVQAAVDRLNTVPVKK